MRKSWYFLLLPLFFLAFSQLQANENQNGDTKVKKVKVLPAATEKAEQNHEKQQEKEQREKLEKMASRGKMLYLNHCHVCHESNVHIRAHRKVKKKSDIGYWVKRWSKYLKLNWKESDRLQVIEHLNQTYYKF